MNTLTRIVTRGLGTRSLICRGFGFWEFIKEIIKRILRLPWKRKRILFRIRVTGSPVFPFKDTLKVQGDSVHPFEENIQVQGLKDFTPVLFILLDEEEDEE